MKEETIYDAIDFEYDEEYKLDHRTIKIIHHKKRKVIKMKDTFTVAEIRRYILSQDSLGDVMYNLSAENIIKANEIKLENEIICKELDGNDMLALHARMLKNEDEIDNYFHCDRCGADLNEACNCGELR